MLKNSTIQVLVVLAVGLGIGWFAGASRMQAGPTQTSAPPMSPEACGPLKDCCLPGVSRAGLMK